MESHRTGPTIHDERLCWRLASAEATSKSQLITESWEVGGIADNDDLSATATGLDCETAELTG